MTRVWDAIVIGGGPAGCTVSTTLSQWGRRVLLLERERFPRYHVGESLSPGIWKVLDRLGVGAAVRDAGFVTKAGSTFVQGGGGQRWSVYYGPAGDGHPALQVRRAEFDHILLRHAAVSGVQVHEGCRARELLRDGDRVVGVRFDGPDGGERVAESSWVVDASGRDAFIARRLGLVEYEPGLANTAVWGYWEGCERLPGREAGNTLCVDHEIGMTWCVPLDDRTGVTCVGVVVRPAARESLSGETDRVYRRMVRGTEAVTQLLDGAHQVGPVRTGSASAYCASRFAGPGWLLVGDAACFVDPIIAGGVQLALHHGALAALVLNTALDEPAWQDEATAGYDRLYRHQYDAFTRIAANVYATRHPEATPEGPRIAPRAGLAAPSDAGGPIPFLSLVSGLSPGHLLQALGEHSALRTRAEERRGGAVIPGEEEGFAFLTWLGQRERLQASRATRIGEELADDSVVRTAPGAAAGSWLFLPSEGGRRLVRRRAVTNRFGDRFELSPELESLIANLDGAPTCSELESRFAGGRGAGAEHRHAFRQWLQLLADHGLVEWQRSSDRITAWPGTT